MRHLLSIDLQIEGRRGQNETEAASADIVINGNDIVAFIKAYVWLWALLKESSKLENTPRDRKAKMKTKTEKKS